jgi:predicted enzyme related to lactoylglutathione lyase
MPTRDTPWPNGAPCWVDLQVDDAAAARAFYGEVFGWAIHDGPEEYGGYLMALKDGRPVCGLGPKPGGPGSAPSFWTTYFAVDDIDAVVGAATAAGGRFMMEPFDVTGQGRMTVGVDPTGAVFGLWQAGGHLGFGIRNEADTVVWNELHTTDYAGAQAFYAATLGHSHTEIGDGDSFVYSTFTVPGGPERDIGGVLLDTPMPPDMPPYWMTYFAVDDPDATVAAATARGASVMYGPDDTPYGRMAGLRGPSGEVFSVMLPTPPDGATTA